MDKAYEPKKYEEKIAQKWDDAKVSLAKMKSESKTGKSFSVPIPPPNVTGQLHLGHAMMLVIQDIMTRYHRMKGDSTLWLPGTDHAAIATESVVLKNLGVSSREEFTRPEFMEKCFDHTKQTHKTITNQVKRMGASCDFTRERYTMDTGLSNAVWKIFKDLYDQDLIVRGHRMVNWSTGAQSVLADDELEYEDIKEPFFYIKCGRFVMGTVRAETKCANSPLVLHPDEQYVVAKFTATEDEKNESSLGGVEMTSEEFIFSEVLFDDFERRNKIFNQLGEGTWEKISTHPGKFFEGEKFSADTYSGEREFFVLCDDEVIDINKGTGSMTISVQHSADDYLLAKKYPEVLKDYYFEKIGFDGKMTKLAGELAGVEVKIARKRAGKIMAEKGLLVGLDKKYEHNVPLCYRTGCVVEPMISPQWFIDVNKEFDWVENVGVVKNGEVEDVKTLGDHKGTPLQNAEIQKKSLKKLTLEAITAHGGDINLIPDRFTKIYDQWIENLQDWCISRQIWWGHQIPIWYDEEGNEHVAHEQKLLFARHGESEDNQKNIIGGDSSLTIKGQKQAEELGKKLQEKNITKIICSDLKRAKETAEIIQKNVVNSHGCSLPEIQIWSDFHEVNAGKYENTPRKTKGISSLSQIFKDGNGETAEQVEERAKKIWNKISDLGSSEGSILFVGHNTFTSAVFAVKDGVSAEHFVDSRNRWEMKQGSVKEVIWMMPPKNAKNLRQDEDTLDTWFSSALWPFSTLGWPDKTPDFENFFPTNVLETGHDILFFWVARMIMFSRFATGKNPFTDVYLHGLVCDEKGKKMSKSKGNGIDPLEMIEKFGTDAVRMSLVIGTTPGNQVNIGEKKIEGYRNFANKLWNVSRYIVAMNTDKSSIYDAQTEEKGRDKSMPLPKSLPEQWILSRLQTLITEVSEGIENHQYGEVGQKLYDFTWNDLADWAIESSKSGNSETIGHTLHQVLTTLLKILHPYIPFVTEQIWEEIGRNKLLALEIFPTPNTALKNTKAEEKFQILQNVIAKIRSLRSASKVDPVKKITAILTGENIEFLKENAATIILMGRLDTLEFEQNTQEECVEDIVNGTQIFLPLAGMLDMEKEAQRKEKELDDARKMLKNLEGRLANTNYMQSAPAHLVQQTKDQYAQVQQKITVLEGK